MYTGLDGRGRRRRRRTAAFLPPLHASTVNCFISRSLPPATMENFRSEKLTLLWRKGGDGVQSTIGQGRTCRSDNQTSEILWAKNDTDLRNRARASTGNGKMATTTAVALRDPTITAIEAYPMALEEVRCA